MINILFYTLFLLSLRRIIILLKNRAIYRLITVTIKESINLKKLKEDGKIEILHSISVCSILSKSDKDKKLIEKLLQDKQEELRDIIHLNIDDYDMFLTDYIAKLIEEEKNK